MIKSIFCAVVLLAISTVSSAGYFVGVNDGYAQVSQGQDKMTNLWSVDGGYNFGKYIGIEGGYMHYPQAYEAQSVYLAAKGYLPVPNSSLSLYGLLGAAEMHCINGNDLIVPHVGVGVALDVTQHLQLDVQTVAERKIKSAFAFETVTMGLGYRF